MCSCVVGCVMVPCFFLKMGVELVKQGWKWFQVQNNTCLDVRNVGEDVLNKISVLGEQCWPSVCQGCCWFGDVMRLTLIYWKECGVRGMNSLIKLGSASLFLIMWSCFLSLTSISCLGYLLLFAVVAGAGVQYVGFTPGLFIIGIFTILILWKYANFWIAGTISIIGGYLVSVNHARLVLFLATIYSIYSVKVRVGWLGVFLSINLTFFSNDALDILIQWCDTNSSSSNFEELKEFENVVKTELPAQCESSSRAEKSEKLHSLKSSSPQAASSAGVNTQIESGNRKEDAEELSSIGEMKRILSSKDYYKALGFTRLERIDAAVLKQEYRRKAMLVHPDKNKGSVLASESFKKLQCAYEVLSDSAKRKDYNEQLLKEELDTRNECTFCSEESRRIQCTKCGNAHVWVCTTRTKAKARWCQDCCHYHDAKDGDGWVENEGSLTFDKPNRVEIPRAFVCAESKIFDVSEWAICQGMACRANTHRPSFHVNMVASHKTQPCNSAWYPWDLDAKMSGNDNDDDFELWLRHILSSGLFSESCKRRKSWSPFKSHQKKLKKQWRRSFS